MIQNKKRSGLRALRVNLVVLFFSITLLVVSLFAPLFLYTIVVLFLLYDYFVLLGGNIYWLNRIIDDKEFHGTGIYRRMLAIDAKMIILAVASGLWLIYFADSHINNAVTEHIYIHKYHHMDVYEFIRASKNNGIMLTEGIPIFIYLFFIKMYILGQLVHSIHHIIINEKLTGMKFSGFAPLTKAVQKLIRWARG